MYHERLEFLKRLARDAGKMTLEGFGQTGPIPKDGLGEYDISTEYDLKTEELIRSRILQEFDEPILGEEDGLIGDRETAMHALWIVDPIDGTFNYQRGIPLYGVTIAYCEESVPVCGAIFLPALGQLFSAAEDLGACLTHNGESKAISVKIADPVQDASKLVIAVGGKKAYRLITALSDQQIPRRSLRYFMCAVACLAYVASGRLDAYLHSGLYLWDCAAGDILLREAGGPGLSDHSGVPVFPQYVTRLAADHATDRFPIVAAASHRLIEDPIRRLLACASLPAQQERT